MGAINKTTIYGDNGSATEGGDDSISIAGTASGSYIYANSGDDSVHLVGNVTASQIYLNTGDDSVSIGWFDCWHYDGGEGKDSVYVVDGVSTASLVDGGAGNDFLSLGALSGTSSLLGGAGADSITVAGNSTQLSGWSTLVPTLTLSTSLTLQSAPQSRAEAVRQHQSLVLFLRVSFKAKLVTTPSTSLAMVLPAHRLKQVLVMT